MLIVKGSKIIDTYFCIPIYPFSVSLHAIKVIPCIFYYSLDPFQIIILLQAKNIFFVLVVSLLLYSRVSQCEGLEAIYDGYKQVIDTFLLRIFLQTFTCAFRCAYLITMVLRLYGNSQISAHARSNHCYLICLRHLIRSR